MDIDAVILSPLANLAGVAGGVILVYVGLMRFVPAFRTRVVMRPISWRRAKRAGVARATWRELRTAVKAHLRGETTRAGTVLGELLRLHGDPSRPTPWGDWHASLQEFLTSATAPDTTGVAPRLIVPEQVQRLDELLHGMLTVLRRFERVDPVPRKAMLRPPRGCTVASTHFASALTGAAVLVDAGSARSSTADDVLTWADTTYRDEKHTWADKATYEKTKGDFAFDDASRVGDYNGRLVELNGVTLAANSHEGQVAFVLETTETCYRATEPGPNPIPAKGLFGASSDPRLAVFRFPTDEHRRGYRRDSSPTGASQRTVPLTSYVSLLTRSEPTQGITVHGYGPDDSGPVDMLVLCRRSRATRNGQDTLSATAGGVVELDQVDVRLDTDDLGTPDVTGASVREAEEELGIPSEQITLAPVAVFIATIDGQRAKIQPGGPSVRGAGQLVASVLHIGTTSLGLDGLLTARHAANASRGAFEVDSLEAFAMWPGDEGLAGFARTARQHAERLDQHGLLSCYYAALRVYSRGVIGAFADAFRDGPWWSLPWQGDETGRTVRVVRDVRQVMPDDAGAITGCVKEWETHWETLPAALDSEAQITARPDA